MAIPKARFTAWRGLELLAVLSVCVSAVGLVAMRLGFFQAWQIWIIAFLSTYAYAKSTHADESSGVEGPPAWHFVLVIAVALLFRLAPYIYQFGGQDQGIYTNMAAHLMHTGGLRPFDTVLAGISATDVRDAYLQSNYRPGSYLPGIYSVDGGLEFQFYHLFPVWLAMFGSILGVENIGYALTFLSLVSLLFFQRLAHVITGSPKAGLVAGLLLAVNPLHAFFSKFPVTEVPTLAFSSISFTFLALYWRAPEGASKKRYLVLSLAGLAMLFMTRISGFMYLPLLLSVMFLALLHDRHSEKRQALVLWAMGASALYAASVAYGLKWSGAYSRDIYALSFAPILGAHWQGILAAIVCVVMLCWLTVWVLAWEESRRLWARRVVGRLMILLPLAIAGATALAIWKAYKLGYTDAYAGHLWYDSRFRLSHGGVKALRSVSLIASIFYISPLMLLAFYAACAKLRFSPISAVLLVFVSGIYAHVAILQWVLPYQPYYARYLVSEFVPYMILFVVVVWASLGPGSLRRFITFAFAFSGLWATGLSAMQIGKNEHDGIAQSLARLTSHLDARDIVFLDASLTAPATPTLKTALIYTYGLHVVTASQEDLGKASYGRGLARRYHDVFYVSRSSVAPAGFAELDSVGFDAPSYCHGVSPPMRLCRHGDNRLILYKRVTVPPPSPGEIALEFAAGSPEVLTLVGTVSNGMLAADGRQGFIMYGPYQPLSAGKYSIFLSGSASTPFTLDISAGKGVKKIASHDYPRAQDSAANRLANVEFELQNPVDDLEVRVYVKAGSDIKIAGYSIVHR